MTQLNNSIALLERDLNDLDPLVQSDIRIKMYEAACLKSQAEATDCESTRVLLLAKSNLAFLASVRIEDLARSSLEHRLASNKILSRYKGVQLLCLEVLYIFRVRPVRHQIRLVNRLVRQALYETFCFVRSFLWVCGR
jgi:hypothetical protein